MPGKLPATWLAAFAINVLTGVTVLIRGGIEITGQPLVDTGIYGTLLFNILFFFYVEAYTEVDTIEQARLQRASIVEWYLRAFNQFLLSALWLLLEKGLGYFLAGFLLFYVVLLFWDFIVCHAALLKGDRSNIPIVVRYDIYGSIITVVFITAVLAERVYRGDNVYLLPAGLVNLIKRSPSEVHDIIMIIIGICAAAYFFVFVATLKLMGFRLRKVLFDRTQLA